MNNAFDRSAYMPRIIDKKVEEYLENCGAVCVEGPKWSGKNRLCQDVYDDAV